MRVFRAIYRSSMLALALIVAWLRREIRTFKLVCWSPEGGAVYEVSVAAATAVLGYNMFQNQSWVTSGRTRRIVGFAVTGSAAAGDAAVDLKVGQFVVSTKYNTTTGFPTRDHMVPLNAVVPAGELISCIVTDAPGTNPLNILIDIIG